MSYSRHTAQGPKGHTSSQAASPHTAQGPKGHTSSQAASPHTAQGPKGHTPSQTAVRKECKLIRQIGSQHLQNTNYPVPQRLQLFREWYREYREEKQRLQMEQFYQLNGFEAIDDDAKRALIDEVHYEVTGRYPNDDEERNIYTRARHTPMMQVGWYPRTF